MVVLDAEGHLVGVIPIDQLVDDIFFHVVPEEYLPDKADYKDMAKHSKEAARTTARDIMHPPVWTTPQETIREAFRKMRDANLSGFSAVGKERVGGVGGGGGG